MYLLINFLRKIMKEKVNKILLNEYIICLITEQMGIYTIGQKRPREIATSIKTKIRQACIKDS